MTYKTFRAVALSAALGSTPAMAQDIYVETLTPDNMHTALGVNYWNLCYTKNAEGQSLFPAFCDASAIIDDEKKQKDAICQHDFSVREAAIDLEVKQKNLGYDEKQKLWSVAYDNKQSCERTASDEANGKRADAFRQHIGGSLTVTLSR